MYILLIVLGGWGLAPNNSSVTVERLVNQFGVTIVVLQYAILLLVGIYGHLSIITVRIEHRVATTMAAFFAFFYGLASSLGVFIFGGPFNPVSTMLYSFAALVAGIIYLHLKSHQRSGAYGRWRYMR